MLQRINSYYRKFKRFLPQNKLRDDYNKLVRRLKILEAQVEKSAQQLEVAKSNFLKNIYHEIRTPLNSVMGFTNLLNRENLLSDTEKDNYVALINKSSRDFLKIMDDIIQASLLEADMIKINNEDSCSIGDFFAENNSFFSIRKHIAEKTKVALLLSLDDSIKNIQISCDKFRITQVLTHLIDNAFKHTEKGIVEYGCTLKNNMMEFFVKDSSNSQLEGKEKTIFSRFSKINIDEAGNGGLGLGLSICKNLVELMGGEIWFEAKNGHGAIFYFTIPIVPMEVEGNITEALENISKTTLDPVLKRHDTLAV